MKIEDSKVSEAMRQLLAPYEAYVSDLLESCESPIEQLFLCAMLNVGWSFIDGGDYSFFQSKSGLFEPEKVFGRPSCGRILWRDAQNGCPQGFALTQPKIATRLPRNPRVDFAVCVGDARVVVECDGHQWHERTKEQAQRDKSRDRGLSAAGWQVLRFTGSEIWAKPDKCANDLEEVIWAHAGVTV